LAEQILAERAAAGGDWPEVEGGGFLARRRLVGALEARSRGEVGELSPEDAALLDRTAAAVRIPAERMQALARQRAETARERIAAAREIDPRRLQVGEAAAEGDPAVLLEFAAADGGA
jgi:GAF domain-containing protein